MKKGLFRCMGLFTLVFMTAMALSISASAASVSAKTHKPHFFPHLSQVKGKAVTPFADNLSYGGGPVITGTSNTYAIFWEPGNNVASNYNSLILRYFGDIGGTGLYRNNSQYTNSSGGAPSTSKFVASWVDTSSYPESPLTDSDIQNEVSRALSAKGWKSSINNIFFVFTGSGEDLCFDSSQSQCASNTFCAYHDFFGSNTLYAAMPYAASFSCDPGSSPNNNDADQTINVTSHEHMEAVTDPELNAWTDSAGNEIGDKCAWTFGSRNSSGGDITANGHSYILQQEWDNRASGCVMTGP